MEQFIEKAIEWASSSGISAATGLLILILGVWGARLVRGGTRKVLIKRQMEPTLVKFGSNFLYGALVIFVVTAALSNLGIQTTSIIAVLGAAGLAVGLALQSSLSNFAAGIMILIFHPFKVGDFIDGGGVMGTVEELGVFISRLRTPDNKVIFVPNGKLAGDNITNFTKNENRRMDLVVGVGYKEDVRRVKKVLEGIISEEERFLTDPAPKVAVLELADSSVNFAFRPWVPTNLYWDVYFDTMEKIKLRLDEEGIQIPFPQRDVHIHQATEVTAA
ncbi:MAG: mechanosensitive ion channel [bacterium]|nr:mechanosensitive ion channel [bacterium]MDT8366753.1 mechanosensitive ion channel [bacterium]